jgi:NAD(P)-dependent dehydrogenase (short-subunit alcohol dehydrogenase family)
MPSPLDFDLAGKVAVITGASRGIGEAIARGLAAHGCNVVLASRKQEGLDTVAGSINSEDAGRALPIACHTGKPDAIEALFESVVSEFGKLDILVNNAATNPFYGPAVEMPDWAFDKTMEVNVKGYFVMSQAAARLMVEQKSGSIINIASIGAMSPGHGQVVYGMTKAAVIAMTKGLAKELGPAGIRVNAIAPGLVETKFAGALIEDPEIQKHIKENTPLGRHGQPEEIVGAALYLASDMSSFNTGSVIICDGGDTA